MDGFHGAGECHSPDIVDKAVRSVFMSNEIHLAAPGVSAPVLRKKDPVSGFGPPWTNSLHIGTPEAFWQQSTGSGSANVLNESAHVDRQLTRPEHTGAHAVLLLGIV